tara:strand:- start:118 stop:489 length:372 start_codon:yes stop_codon:yes gene_type:complete
VNIFDILEMKEGDRPDYGKKPGAKALKSKVKTYDTIKAALSDGYYGQIFSTKGAGRLYVISKGKWGSKSGRGKIAKGFTKGSATPSADFPSIKKFAARTMVRHGKRSKHSLGKKYMPKGQKGK